MASQYFYDANIRKWILQIIRVFSNYTVQYGVDDAGGQLYSRVPVIWGDSTFSAATIIRLNSENIMPSTPLISIYISDLKYERERTQDPTFVDSKSVRTRQWDATTGAYIPAQANAYNVKRFMPVPYKLSIKVDIVTSNTQQKLQILEQILPLFNPQMEIQKTDNYLAWESLSYLELSDTNWSNRTIPVGQGIDSSYDVATLSFFTPIWMSLPAQVNKMGVIFKVINNISDLASENDLVLNTRQIVTFNQYGIYLNNNNQIFILNQGVETANSSPINDSLYGTPLDWSGILGAYGKIRPGVSQIGLTYDHYAPEILGTITIDPSNSTILLYNVDSSTLPVNTLPEINEIVNPQLIGPGYGLPVANIGQSYLLTEDYGTGNTGNPYGTSFSQGPSGILNGTNTIFTLDFVPEVDTLMVSLNGMELANGVDFTISGKTITMSHAPLSTDILYAYYLYNQNNIDDGFVSQRLTGLNGINTVFSLSTGPSPLDSLKIFYNGQLLTYAEDYTVSGLNVNTEFAPATNDILLAAYRTASASNIYGYVDAITPMGIVDGFNQTFTLPDAPLNMHLYYNGVLQTQGVDYTTSSNVLSYDFAPEIDSVQLAYYVTNTNTPIVTSAWPYVTANSAEYSHKNDIVTYDGTQWAVTFNAAANTGNVQFVFDENTNLQYQWNGYAWVRGVVGPYNCSRWRLII